MIMASLFNLTDLLPELDKSDEVVHLISNTPIKEKTEKQLAPALSYPEQATSIAALPLQASSDVVAPTEDQNLNLVSNPITLPDVTSSPSSQTVASAIAPPQASILTSYFPLTCSCQACQGSNQTSSGSATAQNGSAVASGDQRIDTLLGGYKWGVTTLTYSFYAGGTFYGSETDLATVSDAIKTNVRFILQNVISPLINIDFVEVADSPSSYGQIRYLNSTSPSYAYAYYPFSTDTNQGNSSDLAGDVFLKTSYDSSNNTNGFQGGIGTHGYLTLIHETLHAIGLKHPGNYNGSGTGDGPFLPFNQDNYDNTVMTYNFTSTTAGTPMAYDVLALQYLYGARSFNASDTNYTFSSLFGYSDGTRNVGSTTTATKLTLWDSGGTDTLNFSGLGSGGYYFDLNPGGWLTNTATLSSQTYQARSDTSGNYYTANGAGTRVGFGVTIENAIGTASNDTLLGNDADNGLSSGGGNDYLTGAAGNDTLTGSTGNSTLLGGVGSDVYYTQVMNDTITENANEGIDTVRSNTAYTLGDNLERLGLQNANNINGTGNSLDNMIVGNTGDNILAGQAGQDTLMGGVGNDTLLGGLGNDVFIVDNIGDVVIENVNEGIDTVRSFISFTLGDNLERLGMQGSSHLAGTGNGLDNTIVGNTGNNLLNGQSGKDSLSGGVGNDTLIGGAGDDILTGNAGNDFFLYATGAAFIAGAIGIDRLTDFGRTANNTDKIVLSSTTFNAGTSFANVATDALAATSGAFITFSTGTGKLFYNQNGAAEGLGSGGQFLALSNVSSLITTDFTFVA